MGKRKLIFLMASMALLPSMAVAQLDRLYWVNGAENAIQKVGANDAAVDVISDLVGVSGIEVTSEYIYFTQLTDLRRARLDGSELTTLLELDNSLSGARIAYDDGFLYLTRIGSNGRVSGGHTARVRLSDLQVFDYTGDRGYYDIGVVDEFIYLSDGTLVVRLAKGAASANEFEVIPLPEEGENVFARGGVNFDVSSAAIYTGISIPAAPEIFQTLLETETTSATQLRYLPDFGGDFPSIGNFQWAGGTSFALVAHFVNSEYEYSLWSLGLFVANSITPETPYGTQVSQTKILDLGTYESAFAFGDMALAPLGTDIPVLGAPPELIQLTLDTLGQVSNSSAFSFLLSWPSDVGVDYQVLSTTDLNQTWSTIATVTADATTTTYQIDRSAGSPPTFYQVRVAP